MRLWLAVLMTCLACNGAARTAPPAAPAAGNGPAWDALPDVVADWGGGTVTAAQLDAELEAQLTEMNTEFRQERYELRSQTLDQLIDQALLEQEAAARGLAGADELIQVAVEEAVGEPGDEILRAEYDRLSADMPGVPFDTVRPFLVDRMRQGLLREAFIALMEGLRENAKVARALPYPDLPRAQVVTAGAPSLGPDDAPITLIEFGEFQCPYCGMAAPTVAKLMEKYEGKIRLVYKDYPLPGHDRAMPSAVASWCARDQQKYWPYHHALMSDQSLVEDAASLRGVAEGAGLDLAAFDACVVSGVHEAAIQQSAADGEAAGVQATPTFFVNGL